MNIVAIDRAGSLDAQATGMLKLLEHLLASDPVEVRVFDTSRKTDAYTCIVSYSHAANVVRDV